MSKLTLHIQSFPPWFGEFIHSSGVDYVKVIDPPEQDPCPGVKVLARFYMDDNQSNALVRQGAAGAETWFDWMLPRCKARRWLHAVEGPNEPQPMGDASFRAALDAFTSRLVYLCNVYGLKLVGHNWGVGWPDSGTAWEFGNSLNALAAGGHYLGLHEYSAPTMQSNADWLTLRHRKTFAELRSHGIFVPRTIIGETGIDGGVIGQPRQGWKYYTDESGYLSQLAWFDTEIKKDPEIVCATIFTCCNWDWQSFDITESLGMDLADYIWLDDVPQPSLEPEPVAEYGIDVSEWQGVIDWQQVANSGIQFAFIRASVCRTDGTVARDRYFVENWQGAKAASLKRGAYHYLHEKGTGQAAFFASTVGPDMPELGYWADIEDSSLTAAKCESFLAALARNTGQQPGIYTSASIFDRFGAPAWAATHDLWVAHWNTDAPLVPKAWVQAGKTWKYWQYSNSGAVPGITGRVDMDQSYGEAPPSPSQEEGEPMALTVVDMYGTEQSWDWVMANYGPVGITGPSAGVDAYRVIQLTEIEGPMAFTATVLNSAGGPVVGKQVAYMWPSGESVEITNGNGMAEHTAGAGEGYDPHNGPGPISWQVRGGETETISGLGWLWGTNHRHLQVIFQWGKGGTTPTSSPSPSPSTPPSDDVVELLSAILAELVVVRSEVEGMNDELDAINLKLAAGWTVK